MRQLVSDSSEGSRTVPRPSRATLLPLINLWSSSCITNFLAVWGHGAAHVLVGAPSWAKPCPSLPPLAPPQSAREKSMSEAMQTALAASIQVMSYLRGLRMHGIIHGIFGVGACLSEMMRARVTEGDESPSAPQIINPWAGTTSCCLLCVENDI